MSKYFDVSGTIGFTCDVCGRELLGCTWVNGMRFCAKCYQETFGNKLVFPNETGKFVDLLNTEMYELKISNLEHKLEEKDQQIAELEEQLKNAIVPKFKKGQEVWFIYNFEDDNETLGILHKKVMFYTYNNYEGDYFEYAMSDDGIRDTMWYGCVDSKYIFATKEEAQEKLKELQGE